MKTWVSRFDDEDIKGLLNKPRGYFKPVPDDIRVKIVDLKRENPLRSARWQGLYGHSPYFIMNITMGRKMMVMIPIYLE